jgi:hypothetical protein
MIMIYKVSSKKARPILPSRNTVYIGLFSTFRAHSERLNFTCIWQESFFGFVAQFPAEKFVKTIELDAGVRINLDGELRD